MTLLTRRVRLALGGLRQPAAGD